MHAAAGVFEQRLRWAIGSLQILARDNPLAIPGLTFPQRLLFFESAAHHWLALPTLLMSLLPLAYLAAQVSVMQVEQMWEFVAAFGCYYGSNRAMVGGLWCPAEQQAGCVCQGSGTCQQLAGHSLLPLAASPLLAQCMY